MVSPQNQLQNNRTRKAGESKRADDLLSRLWLVSQQSSVVSLWRQSVEPSAALAEEHEHVAGTWLAGFSVVLQKHDE
jgi:hypothetical protein